MQDVIKRQLPLGEGLGEGSGEADCGGSPQRDSTLSPHPHPALRATFSRREKDRLG